jgi:hypothetical protein
MKEKDDVLCEFGLVFPKYNTHIIMELCVSRYHYVKIPLTKKQIVMKILKILGIVLGALAGLTLMCLISVWLQDTPLYIPWLCICFLLGIVVSEILM